MTKPTTVNAYIKQLPDKRKEPITAVRTLILETIPEASETMRYNMPTYEMEGEMVAALASQKNYMSLYMDVDLIEAHKADFGHLNCGKSCIRFKKTEDLPMETVKTILRETAAQRQAPT